MCEHSTFQELPLSLKSAIIYDYPECDISSFQNMLLQTYANYECAEKIFDLRDNNFYVKFNNNVDISKVRPVIFYPKENKFIINYNQEIDKSLYLKLISFAHSTEYICRVCYDSFIESTEQNKISYKKLYQIINKDSFPNGLIKYPTPEIHKQIESLYDETDNVSILMFNDIITISLLKGFYSLNYR